MTLLFSEVKDLNVKLAHLINAYRLARAAAKQSTLALDARHIAAVKYREIEAIGDRLSQEVANVATVDALVQKSVDHGYWPSLGAAAGTPEKLLADVYDIVAETRGLAVRAYRQGFDAEGRRD